MIDTKDRRLGMERPITRRDFLQGVSQTLGALLLARPADGLEALGPRPGLAGDYPPARTGLRGAHDGSWETAHALRDGQSWEAVAQETGETFDLVVVGGGISGLSAAYFFRLLGGPRTRVLILDNHDDFGGHAKRNEFRSRGRLLLGYGGTQSIEAPARYSREARQLLQDLGIEVQRFYHYFDQELFPALKLAPGLFFDRETFGADRLVVGIGKPSWAEFLARTPLSKTAQRDLARLYNDHTVDYLTGLTVDEKKRCNAPSLPIPADAPILKAMPPQVAATEEVFGRADMRRGCIPGAHGIMNARSSVRLFAMLANGGELDGVRLLSEERVQTFSTPRADTDKPDSVLGIPVRMGTAGFWLGGSTDPKDPFRLAGLNPRTLFHPGAGGAVAWGDPDARLAVAICHNGMSNNPSKTFQPIRAAVEQVFGAL